MYGSEMTELYYEDVEIGDDIGPQERVVNVDQVRRFLSVRGGTPVDSRFTSDRVREERGACGRDRAGRDEHYYPVATADGVGGYGAAEEAGCGVSWDGAAQQAADAERNHH